MLYTYAMPITKQAIKKMRRDRTRRKHNTTIREEVRETVKAMRKKPTVKALQQAFRRLDKAAKTGVLHKNKAARLKSRLSRLIKV